MTIHKNGEGYMDLTAAAAIKEADRHLEEVSRLVKLLKYLAEWGGFEVTNRIWLRDKKTGREYR